jgi:hypothetical protein
MERQAKTKKSVSASNESKDRVIEAILSSHVFKMTAIMTDNGPVPDMSTLPDFIIEYNAEYEAKIMFAISQIHTPAPAGVYMIRHSLTGEVFQGVGLGMGFWYPTSNMPEAGLSYYYTKQDAIMDIEDYHVKAWTGSRVTDFEVVSFNSNLENTLYMMGRWASVWEERPVALCPQCLTPNPEPSQRWFTCQGCMAKWEGVYCPVNGTPGYCTSSCTCHEILLRSSV